MANISQHCNNPINLMLNEPVGECTAIYRTNTHQSPGYCMFPTSPAGWRAAHRQIHTDQERGMTLEEFIAKFAPPDENDTSAYLEFVCKAFGVQPTIPLEHLNKYALAGVMAQFEGYYNTED